MKNGCLKILFSCYLLLGVTSLYGQRFNVGLTFQYLILKQIKVDTDIIEGSNSYSLYYVKDNNWKFFSGGQSFIIGAVFQLDYKKFYAVLEPSFDLNSYNYSVYYPVSPERNERLNFQHYFLQVDFPLYAGYQFASDNLLRYSLFGGVIVGLPYAVGYDLKSKQFDNPQYGNFNTRDMENILYNDKMYMSTLAGVCLHFANLGKVDLRFQHRLGSPGKVYSTTFNSIGLGLTYYLPLNIKKQKIYYEN